MIRSVPEPSSLTSQRPPPQTPLAMNSRPYAVPAWTWAPLPGRPGTAAKNDQATSSSASARNTTSTSAD